MNTKDTDNDNVYVNDKDNVYDNDIDMYMLMYRAGNETVFASFGRNTQIIEA